MGPSAAWFYEDQPLPPPKHQHQPHPICGVGLESRGDINRAGFICCCTVCSAAYRSSRLAFCQHWDPLFTHPSHHVVSLSWKTMLNATAYVALVYAIKVGAAVE